MATRRAKVKRKRPPTFDEMAESFKKEKK